MKLLVWVFSWIGGLSRNFGGGLRLFPACSGARIGILGFGNLVL